MIVESKDCLIKGLLNQRIVESKGCWIKGLLKDCLRRSSGGHGFGKLPGVQEVARGPRVQEVFRRAGDQVGGRRSGPGGDHEAKCSGSRLVVMQLRFAVVGMQLTSAVV